MEALSLMMLVIVIRGFIYGFSVGARSDDLVFVSHSFLLMIPSFFVELAQTIFSA
jgi:hypothetical protein